MALAGTAADGLPVPVGFKDAFLDPRNQSFRIAHGDDLAKLRFDGLEMTHGGSVIGW